MGLGEEASAAAPDRQLQHSPWHSPVPYLFGGLAAMLGLIAFALLILACSYWKLSGYLEGGNEREGNDDLENGHVKRGDAGGIDTRSMYEQKIVVIMAGQNIPTFLVTPVNSDVPPPPPSSSIFQEPEKDGRGEVESWSDRNQSVREQHVLSF
ncbi:Protein GLUTAMINE DUMPER 4 [Zostera marina]|uniref:Protein GLUTAMINE DUMPER 4 n=1 Tax=Zostera marina TaxID=29655 RepID=A0A0K9P1I8_ZOSMR|nr:Protein GLUTAMINE DUMPER 4 [Zostera marina]